MDALHEITEQLVALQGGDNPEAWDRLVPLVYAEFRAIAHRQLHREQEGHTLSTTALVHEAYLRLVGQDRAHWQDRAHFFAVAATAMRRVLIDYARAHRAEKRAGKAERIPFDSAALSEVASDAPMHAVAAERAETLVALDSALDRLALLDERLVRVVECRFFGGLTEAETALALGVTDRTVRRDWLKAKGWLQRALDE